MFDNLSNHENISREVDEGAFSPGLQDLKDEDVKGIGSVIWKYFEVDDI
jgi:hypothetical protein